MNGVALFSLLEWDSEFFGRRIARVKDAAGPADLADRLVANARAERIDCFYFLVDSGNSETIRTAENLGFHLVDIRVTLELEFAGSAEELPSEIDLFCEEDVPRLRSIARTSHAESRFYVDPGFPRERCDALYETWIENACKGSAAGVLVARDAGRAVGYTTCEISSQGVGQLGLVAVSSEVRGEGHGGRLVAAAVNWLGARGCEQIRVVTQARNIAAARLYEGQGFRTSAVENWYHLWLNDEGPK